MKKAISVFAILILAGAASKANLASDESEAQSAVDLSAEGNLAFDLEKHGGFPTEMGPKINRPKTRNLSEVSLFDKTNPDQKEEIGGKKRPVVKIPGTR